jgi:hypothetical protein
VTDSSSFSSITSVLYQLYCVHPVVYHYVVLYGRLHNKFHILTFVYYFLVSGHPFPGQTVPTGLLFSSQTLRLTVLLTCRPQLNLHIPSTCVVLLDFLTFLLPICLIFSWILKMEAVYYSEMWVKFCRSARQCILEDSYLLCCLLNRPKFT